MMKYVAGFLFSNDYKYVALIKKEKPAWQKGKLNAIGGKIEPGETAFDAQRREFREETGLDVEDWHMFTDLGSDDFNVAFFYAVVSKHELGLVTTTTDEEVFIVPVEGISNRLNQSENIIPNLSWLIPMALTIAKKQDMTQSFCVREK